MSHNVAITSFKVIDFGIATFPVEDDTDT